MLGCASLKPNLVTQIVELVADNKQHSETESTTKYLWILGTNNGPVIIQVNIY